MSADAPSALALFWAGVIGFSILVYVILDGFDLGVGMFFGATDDKTLRDEAMGSIAPFWDGNETWLIVVGASLFAAFPAVYAIFLSAFYLPVLLLLFGLIFRGVAFEFRGRGGPSRLWDVGFWAGSGLVSFVQGAAVGAMILGVTVENGHFAGGPLDWLRPLPVLTGVGLMFGYGLLGAGWLILKTDGRLRELAYERAPKLAAGMAILLALASFLTLVQAHGVVSRIIERPYALGCFVVGAAALYGVFASLRARRDAGPFLFTILFFLAAFGFLALAFWPYMIPYSVTVANAAAPDASLSFLFWGAGLVALPAVIIYSIAIHGVFRGKLKISGH